MKLSDEVDGEAPHMANAKRGPLAQVYKNVLMQVQAIKRKRRFGNLWSRVAPSANIYRYLGISQERLRHCLDLNRQLKELADDPQYEKLFEGGFQVDTENRSEQLLKALKETRVKGTTSVFGMEEQEVEEGFLPLEEFLDKDVACTCGVIIHPADPEERSQWFFNIFLALIVFFIQTLAPAVMIVQLWDGGEDGTDNHIKDLSVLWGLLNWKEVTCLGQDAIDVCTTFCGTLFVLMLYFLIHNHVRDEHEDATKMGRLPGDNFWLGMSNLSQSLCPLLILVAAPLEYWSEPGVTGILMNSMAMLFVWTLDDLSGDVFGYIGEEDKDFQKQASWNYALLAYCPVYLRDVIDPTATKLEDLWKISYNKKGNLVTATSEETYEQPDGDLCETRIMARPDENTPLMEKDEDDCLETLVVQYRVQPHKPVRHLPGSRETMISACWTLAKIYVALCAVVPVIWFVCNKPCSQIKTPKGQKT